MTPSELQKRLAKTLGIDLSGDSFRIAAARIYEAVWPAIEFQSSDLPVSDKQIAFGRDIGIDVSGGDRFTASLQISARLDVLNEVALRDLDLRPGDKIVLKGSREVLEVSCVGKNRKIFPRGWGGQSVWATQVSRKVRSKK